MARIYYCKRCGAKLLSQPGGPCPRCLLGAALDPGPAQPPPLQSAQSEPEPIQADAGQPAPVDVAATVQSPVKGGAIASELPTAVELAPYFPQLEILELLGRGGMGAVYKARQRGLDRLVAVKILPPSAGQAPGFAERFTREARALARLNHPGIVAVYDFGHAQGLYYFVMEYVDGSDLRRLIRSGVVTPKQALAIVPQICDALQYAHDAGVIHRDIKPENILLDKKGVVKIADFGLAKLFGLATPDYTLTAAECSMGTPRYMAPEQMDNPKSVDHRADIYSLGVVFYEMLTGEVPAGRFAVPSEKSKSDARLDAVVLRSLEKEPKLRYQKVSDVKSAVQTVCSTPPPPPVQPPPLPRPVPAARPAPKRKYRKRVALVCIALLAVGVVIMIIVGSSETPHMAPQSADGKAAQLMRAVEQGDSQEVQRLLYSGADANTRDASGDTPLTKAAALGLKGPAEELLQSSKEPDGRSARGETPLALAAKNGHSDVVQSLLQYGAQVNARGNSKGQTALLLAAANGHMSAVELLMSRTADLNLRDDDGLTPLVYAEAHGWPEVAKLLRERGAIEDPNCGFTEAYMNAMDGKAADAIPQIEKLLALNVQSFQRPWHIVAKEWTYTVPRPQLVLTLVQAECYQRTGQTPKAKEILVKSFAGLSAEGPILLYRRDHSEANDGVQDSFSLDPGDLQTWSADPSIPPHLTRSTQTDGFGMQPGQQMMKSEGTRTSTVLGVIH